MKDFNLHDYSDIINLEHHVSKRHKPMPVSDRAAQFGAFSALTGHNDAINETARLTDSWENMSEYAIEALNSKLQYINDKLPLENEVLIKYFKPDNLKDGGEYLFRRGVVRRIDEANRLVIFNDGFEIEIDNIFDIDIENMQ